MPGRRHTVVARTYNKRGRLLAAATNSYTKTHPLQAHFAMLAGEPDKKYLHAEIAALLRSNSKRIHRIEIERFNSAGYPVLAKPCKICQMAIRKWRVREVVHT